MTSTANTSIDVDAIRKDFAFLNVTHPCGLPIAYLDNGASTQHPRQVLAAMQDCYEHAYANVHRGIHYLSEVATDRYETARAKVSSFLNSPSADQIIFAAGCTAAINLVAQGWGHKFTKSSDRILTTIMEHHANIVPWYQLRELTGVSVDFVAITSDGSLDLDDFARGLETKPKLVAVTAVSNVLGTINPIKKITQMAHEAGALVLVDAAQAAPHHAIDVCEWDCDFLVFSGHKMVGPSGIGVLYGKAELLNAMEPFLGGGGMIDVVTTNGFTPGPVPSKFEAGTPPIVEAVGLGAAVDYLSSVGLNEIGKYEATLTSYAYQQLSEIDGLKVLGPDAENRAGIISFVMDGIHAHDIAQILDSYGVAVRAGHHCTMPLHSHLGIAASARASFYLYNTVEEVDRLISGLRAAKQRFRRR
jgi:cysteine desulfurase/selenocysteine lyase